MPHVARAGGNEVQGADLLAETNNHLWRGGPRRDATAGGDATPDGDVTTKNDATADTGTAAHPDATADTGTAAHPDATAGTNASAHPEATAGSGATAGGSAIAGGETTAGSASCAGSDEEGLLDAAAQLWIAGIDIDWPRTRSGPRRRVALPTYPFERKRHWIERPVLRATSASHSSGRRAGLADWFYAPIWRQSARALLAARGIDGGAAADTASARMGPWLLFADDLGIADSLAQRLGAAGERVVRVERGARFETLGAGRYSVRPNAREDYVSLCGALDREGALPRHIAHLWGIAAATAPPTDDLASAEQQLQHGFYSLLNLVQALDLHAGHGPVQIDAVSNDLLAVLDEPVHAAARAAALGILRVLPQEMDRFACRHIDIHLEGVDAAPAARIDELLAELRSPAREPLVAYRRGKRWLPDYERVALPPAPAAPRALSPTPVPAPASATHEERAAPPTPAARAALTPPTAPAAAAAGRDGPVVLITGGLGGIGLVLARHLAATRRARLVLTGRSGLPRRETWPEWIAQHGEDDQLSRRIRAVEALEAAGAEVLVVAADAADLQATQAAVRAARARFAGLHGVVHAAGLATGGMVATRDAAAAAQVLDAKVKGTLVLQAALRDAIADARDPLPGPLDFLVLCSSLAADLGTPGEADYCGANAFLAAWAQAPPAGLARRVVAVDWDLWAEVGMGVETAVPAALSAARQAALALAIRPAEGAEAFDRILASPLSRVCVSTLDLFGRRVERGAAASGAAGPPPVAAAGAAAASAAAAAAAKTAAARPELPTPYVAPRSSTEQAVADIGMELLGLDQLGANDDLFELGLDSLLSHRLIARIKRQFQVTLSVRAVMEKPTVAQLAKLTEAARWAALSSRPSKHG
jgi:NADP-dependent 3-hydroxy acid dehydrogenase YdfG/acyl carrier protein